MYTLLGLLERPLSRSFGIIPIIVRETSDALPEVCGLSDASSWRRFKSTEEAEQILQRQGLNLASPITTFASKPTGMIAGWTGSDFLRLCHTHHVPPPKAPASAVSKRTVTDISSGEVWIAPVEDAYASMDNWLKTAATLACEQKSIGISRLMIWCHVTHELTQAVDWYVAFDENSRENYLKWHQIYPLNRGMDTAALEARHRILVERLLDKS